MPFGIMFLLIVFPTFVARETNLWKQIVLGTLGCIGGILLSLVILIYCLRIHSEAVSSLTELALARDCPQNDNNDAMG